MGSSILNTAGSVASIVAACASLYGVWAVRSLTIRFRHRQGLQRWAADLEASLLQLEEYSGGNVNDLVGAADWIFWIVRQAKPGSSPETRSSIDALLGRKDVYDRSLRHVRRTDSVTPELWEIQRQTRSVHRQFVEDIERRRAGEE